MRRLKRLYKRFVAPVLQIRPRNGAAFVPYFRDRSTYRKLGGQIDSLWPILGEDTATTGIDPHYFYQGAWALRHIAGTRPVKHVDVGSQTDLIAHLPAIVPTSFVDLRPITVTVPGLTVVRGSVLAMPFKDESVVSLSCLHVVEHIGLGRYGDPLDPEGTRKACTELSRVLAPGGQLYLSVPVGRERTEFNAHRIHHPETIIRYFETLRLESFSGVNDQGVFVEHAKPKDYETARYALGLFRFTRLKNS